jgi:hypothetical protein
MADKRIYRVTFFNRGEVYEVYARSVGQGGLAGFIEVEELLFGERSSVVVDPSEERLQREFEGVRRFYVPMHTVVRIDEVERQGTARITTDGEGGKIASFPAPFYPGSGDKPQK